jgi:hypothetical protein
MYSLNEFFRKVNVTFSTDHKATNERADMGEQRG